MEHRSTRTGLAATAAVHVAIAGLLLAGWQVTRPKAPPKPVIVTAIPEPVAPTQSVAPRTSEQAIRTEIPQPVWDEARPDPVLPPPIGDAGPQGAGAGPVEITAPPLPPPPAAGPTRGARLLTSAAQPPYPSLSRALGEEGTVEILVSIDERGGVTGVSLLRSSGHERLDAAALAFALKRWRFEAAQKDGQPVATSRRFTIRFALADGR